MTKKFQKKPTALTLGAAVAATLSAGSIANAETNPFGVSELPSGYMQLAEAEKKDGSCGAGKCGGKMKEKMEKKDGKCGAGKCGGEMKDKDGNCAGDKKGAKKSEGECGEGKCGEGKCGGKK